MHSMQPNKNNFRLDEYLVTNVALDAAIYSLAQVSACNAYVAMVAQSLIPVHLGSLLSCLSNTDCEYSAPPCILRGRWGQDVE